MLRIAHFEIKFGGNTDTGLSGQLTSTKNIESDVQSGPGKKH